MNRVVVKIFSVALVAVMVLGVVGTPVAAQDDDRQALVDRLIAAAGAIESYESFVRTESNSQVLTMVIGIPLANVEQTQYSSVYSEAVSNVISGDSPNVQSFFTIGTEQYSSDGSEETETNVAVEGEVRVVDNVLYLTADVVEDNGDFPLQLPDGWVVITTDFANEDLEDLAAFDIPEFSFDDLLGFLFDDGEEDSLSEALDSENLTEFLALATDISLSQETLDDGTPVDVITATFNALEAFQSPVFSSSGLPEDPTTAAFIESLFGDAEFEVSFAIDDQERLIGIYFNIDLAVETDDLSTLIDVAEFGLPEGLTMELTMELNFEYSLLYTNINEALTPVEAPADAVPAE